MDPLSVGGSIVGILAAAAKLSSAIATVVSDATGAKREILAIREEVEGIQNVLLQLQAILFSGEGLVKLRTSLILVDQVVITLSAIVTTLSELDVFVKILGSDDKLKLLERVKWTAKKGAAEDSLAKLQAQKSSLTLMLIILTCKSGFEARDAIQPLDALMKQIINGQTLLAERLANIESNIPIPSARPIDFLASVTHDPDEIVLSSQNFRFEEELKSSWAYKRSARGRTSTEAFSVTSSAARTASWSMFSGLSISEISNIAVLSLPIYAEDLSNGEVYQFGEINISSLGILNKLMAVHKILVLGDADGGKSALVNQFYRTIYDPMIEISYNVQAMIDGVACTMEIFDTGGQEEYTALRDQWIRNSEGFVLVYSVFSRSSFTRIQRLHKKIERIRESSASTNYSLGYPHPLSTIREEGPTATMLVGHHYCTDKWHERHDRVVTKEEGQSLARELECDFMEATTKNAMDVQKVFYDVVRKLRKQDGD